MESTVAVATSPINGKPGYHVAKVRLCRQRENTQKNAGKLRWGGRWGGVGGWGGFRIGKTVIATARRVDVYRSDEAVSLHLGREAIEPRSCE